jgi:uncharacterized membrane protein YccC
MAEVNAGAVAGGVVGGFVACCLIVACAVLCRRRARARLALGLDSEEQRFKRRIEAQAAAIDSIFDDAALGDEEEEEEDAAVAAQLRSLERELQRRRLHHADGARGQMGRGGGAHSATTSPTRPPVQLSHPQRR